MNCFLKYLILEKSTIVFRIFNIEDSILFGDFYVYCLPKLYPFFSYKGDNGTMHFWDWKTGYNFQRLQGTAQPGSLDSECGIFAMTFDQSSSRLITCEADKTIKIYKEDDQAVSNSRICIVCW